PRNASSVSDSATAHSPWTARDLLAEAVLPRSRDELVGALLPRLGGRAPGPRLAGGVVRDRRRTISRRRARSRVLGLLLVVAHGAELRLEGLDHDRAHRRDGQPRFGVLHERALERHRGLLVARHLAGLLVQLRGDVLQQPLCALGAVLEVVGGQPEAVLGRVDRRAELRDGSLALALLLGALGFGGARLGLLLALALCLLDARELLVELGHARIELLAALERRAEVLEGHAGLVKELDRVLLEQLRQLRGPL